MRDLIEARLAAEHGTLYGRGRRSVALVYPSRYSVAMSSLGFQVVYRVMNQLDDTAAERAFLPDDDSGAPLLTYEGGRPASDLPVLAFSVAYELELAGLFACLSAAGVPLLSSARSLRHPWVIAGGPLTFSNPAPLAPFVDAVVMGEAEEVVPPLLDVLFGGGSRDETLRLMAETPGVWVPALHGETPAGLSRCNDALLPGAAAIWTEHATLQSMFLVETERGCSRGCTFCVMRRSTNDGMRVVPAERVLAAVPDAAPRVGLVGAAVSDHPRITDIVQALVDSGRQVGLSSLRSDRLTPELVGLLERAGTRTLTVASDGASERLRIDLDKAVREKHLLRAAELAGNHGIQRLKIYVMLGLPGETDADLEELVAATERQAEAAGSRTRLSLGVSPFVAKRNTPLDGAPFVGVREAERRIALLRRALAPRIEVKPASARWAWVEYALAQGGPLAGLAALEAWRAGGSFAAWKRALRALPHAAAAYDGERPAG
jgi:radical SAM superfamily enzyme YgiQ (UPF0313 family)